MWSVLRSIANAGKNKTSANLNKSQERHYPWKNFRIKKGTKDLEIGKTVDNPLAKNPGRVFLQDLSTGKTDTALTHAENGLFPNEIIVPAEERSAKIAQRLAHTLDEFEIIDPMAITPALEFQPMLNKKDEIITKTREKLNQAVEESKIPKRKIKLVAEENYWNYKKNQPDEKND